MIKALAAGPLGPATVIDSARIVLQASTRVSASAVLAFYERNQAHFARWDPPMPAGFLTTAHHAERMRMANDAFSAGSGYRYWLTEPARPRRVVGSVHFSSVVRGPFQSCTLGYAIDAELQGRGLMHEALEAGIAEMFSPRANLHRIQAAVRPENERSLAVMRRLGFEPIGLAPRYLMIDGDWRDHLLWQRINPGWSAAG